MKFLLDAQLPPAVARWLREKGHEAVPARELGLREATDGAIWAYARQNGMAILTKDEDFATRAHHQQADGPVVVWLRIGNSSNAALRAWLEPRWPGIAQLLAQGSKFVEVV